MPVRNQTVTQEPLLFFCFYCYFCAFVSVSLCYNAAQYFGPHSPLCNVLSDLVRLSFAARAEIRNPSARDGTGEGKGEAGVRPKSVTGRAIWQSAPGGLGKSTASSRGSDSR